MNWLIRASSWANERFAITANTSPWDERTETPPGTPLFLTENASVPRPLSVVTVLPPPPDFVRRMAKLAGVANPMFTMTIFEEEEFANSQLTPFGGGPSDFVVAKPPMSEPIKDVGIWPHELGGCPVAAATDAGAEAGAVSA